MKSSFITVIAAGAFALARDPPSEEEVKRQANDICGKYENIDVGKCQNDVKNCITDSLKRKVEAEIERGDEVFWRHIRSCASNQNLNVKGDSPKNFIAAVPDAWRFSCERPEQDERHTECVFVRPQNIQTECANRDCRPAGELPQYCATLGGCANCVHGLSKFGGDTVDEFTCGVQQNTATGKPSPQKAQNCNDIRLKTFQQCRKGKPDDFNACVNQGQDAFVKCQGVGKRNHVRDLLQHCKEAHQEAYLRCVEKKPADLKQCTKEAAEALDKCYFPGNSR